MCSQRFLTLNYVFLNLCLSVLSLISIMIWSKKIFDETGLIQAPNIKFWDQK